MTRAEEEYDLLVKAEKLAVEKVDRYIQSMGEVTLESADSIRSAFEIYDALSDYGKALVKKGRFSCKIFSHPVLNRIIRAGQSGILRTFPLKRDMEN